jgi:hypothetical protein
MDLNSVFGGDTLKAADLQGTEPTVTIAAVEAKKFDNGNKLILKFVGKKKALVANKTNSKRIAMMYGNDTDDWVGKPITLYVDIVDFQGEPTEAIRVRVKKQQTSVAGGYQGDPISTGRPPVDDDSNDCVPTPPMRRAPVTDLDDEIPF